GGGSLTALPIIETLGGDISAYIPTNVISITDGQIFLETDLFNEGQRPAINVSLSVSRVGGAAQTPLVKQVCASLRTRLAQYRELAEFMQFGADVDEATRKTLRSGRLLTEALKQPRSNPVPDYFQALLIFAIDQGFANNINPEEMHEFETGLFKFFEKEYSGLVEIMKTGKKLNEETKTEIRQALTAYVQRG
ncbi:MAG: F0F1 ATP synthase subunit alpha, partial [Oscillospiraceae bacterium]|nr:F0F1 ATP synthase subunit alpha [Oscillospiraceae bacterium]